MALLGLGSRRCRSAAPGPYRPARGPLAQRWLVRVHQRLAVTGIRRAARTMAISRHSGKASASNSRVKPRPSRLTPQGTAVPVRQSTDLAPTSPSPCTCSYSRAAIAPASGRMLASSSTENGVEPCALTRLCGRSACAGSPLVRAVVAAAAASTRLQELLRVLPHHRPPGLGCGFRPGVRPAGPGPAAARQTRRPARPAPVPRPAGWPSPPSNPCWTGTSASGRAR